MKLLILDRTGHTTLCDTDVDIQAEFDRLMAKGYAAFVNDEHVKSLKLVHEAADVLMLAPLVGG